MQYDLKYQHHDIKDLDFFKQHEVRKMPLQTLQDPPREVDNAYALVRNDGSLATDTAVTGSYTLTNHLDLYRTHNQLIEKSNLPYQRVTVVDEVTPNGLKARRSIQYLDTCRDLDAQELRGDPVYCRSDVVNSVNQTWAFQMFSGAYRSYCENSMVFGGDKVYYAKQKHSKHFDHTSVLGTANNALDDFEKNCNRFKEWKSTPIDDETAMRFLAETFCTYPQQEIEKRAAELVGLPVEDVKYNKKRLASMLVLWDRYKEQLGPNKWSLYNVMTHYATHTHETYTVMVDDKHGNAYETEHTTGRLTKQAPTCQQSANGLNYTLAEQHDRSRWIACITYNPNWHQVPKAA